MSAPPLGLRRQAKAELVDAIAWYDRQRPGLGADFAARVNDVFERISANPQLHAAVHGEVRKARVQRFPYAIFYRHRRNRVIVLAVWHSKRDSSGWKSRA